MTFMENILAHNIPIWEQCAATPFVREMQNGMLPFEKFKAVSYTHLTLPTTVIV